MLYRKQALLFAALLIFGFSLNVSAQVGGPNGTGQWSAVIQMPLVPVGAANLPNGKVLTWSAYDRFAFGGNRGRTYTAIFDPATNQSQELLISNTNHDMFCPGTSQLPDGRIIVTGGSSSGRTSIYDPFTNQWTSGPNLKITRGYHSMVALGDGRIFTIGGSWNGGVGNKHAEIFDGTSWERLNGVPVSVITDGATDPDGESKNDNHAWLWPAPNGKIFHAGPSFNMHWIDPQGNGSYTNAGRRGDDDYAYTGTTVMYDVGKILKAGGAASARDGRAATGNTYIIDINTDQVQVKKVQSLQYTRTKHDAVVLPNGEVLALGGLSVAREFSDNGARLTPEIWSPETEQWRDLAPMQIPRTYHSVAMLLPDGRVFAAGGGLCGGCVVNHPDVQILSPPYLFNSDGSPASRPAIVNAPQAINPASNVTMTTDGAISYFSLIRYNNVTHSVNNEQRRLKLNSTSLGNNQYNVAIPNANIAIPGYYMLFAVNANGTPSIASLIKVNTPGRCPDLPGNPPLGAPCDDGNDCTINDVVKSDCSCEGTPKTDTDEDGICDDLDLDDDNDGILDTNESSCPTGTSAANAFNSLGEARAVPAAGIYYFDINGEAFSTYVDANGYVKIGIDFGDGAGNLPQGNALTQSSRGILTPAILAALTDIEKVRISHSGGQLDVSTSNSTIIGRIQSNSILHQGSSHNGFNNDWTGTNASYMTGDATCNTPGSNGSALHQNIVHTCGNSNGFHWIPSGGTQRYRWSSGEISNAESLSLWVQGTNSVCSAGDLDGDGIPDNLDLDADNDGCPDAIEGGGSFTLSSLDNNNMLAGGVDANGIPLVASPAGQDVGASQNASSVICCDPAVSGYPDSDGDNISDSCDQDDDNDGIRDIDECPTVIVGEDILDEFTFYGNAISISPTEIQLTQNAGGQRGAFMSNNTVSLSNDFEARFSVYLGTNDGGADGITFVLHNDPAGSSAVGAFGGGLGAMGIENGIVIEFDTWNNVGIGDVSANDHTRIWESNTGGFNPESPPNYLTPEFDLGNIEDGNFHDVVINWDVSALTLTYTVNGNLAGTLVNDIAANLINGNEAYFGFTGSTGGATNDQRVRLESFTVTFGQTALCDTDNDNIPNSRDLDSDGDGCLDVFEGGANFDLGDVSTEGRLNGAVNTDPTSDSYGVPLLAGNGQGVGTSLEENNQPANCPDPSNPGLRFGLKFFLEGPFDASSGLMNDNLRNAGLISNTDPYGIGATVSPGLFGQEGANAVVEWIVVELRDKDNPSILVASQALLLQRDGDVMMPDGNTEIGFENIPLDSYYIVIGHLNHLYLSSNDPIDLGSNPTIDFSNPATPVLGGSDGGNIISNTRVLISGDANGDGTVNALDKNSFWRAENGGNYQYGQTKADFNLDGTVNALDKNVLWRSNNSRGEILP